jgi:hypothetical protein
MIIDSLLVCFCEDCKANDGTEERPYYMTNSLRVSFILKFLIIIKLICLNKRNSLMKHLQLILLSINKYKNNLIFITINNIKL